MNRCTLEALACVHVHAVLLDRHNLIQFVVTGSLESVDQWLQRKCFFLPYILSRIWCFMMQRVTRLQASLIFLLDLK